ncbi:MAG: hypothetical protein BGN96_16595 [Bacteroidales bacterium 45-6]|uniref:glycosyltransferase n=1 Tax=uncultured Dysgonomonas sp. TaxID=206096 RepID=UPI0009618D73|nr:glycosyltransferase [uncultured Dysgonomonas sp.]OJU54618.1 MAG: hypothetical protein BGN96_16595 [Bacteroidales bacterium 45-6]
MKELTVIIAFLNEGSEVYKTVKSLKENSDSEFEIILINDCSTDGFDYKQVATEFDTHYIEHDKRRGVAFSRDEGVNLCETKYFLLLDAHMRVYQRNWVELFLKELKKNPKSLLCASTIALDSRENIIEGYDSKVGFGATFRFSDFGVEWISNINLCVKKSANIADIPCVLGASYACSKEYWRFLLGLNGLRYYGCDEQYLSAKVWLAGGQCKVVKNISFGHIFREAENLPYEGKGKEFVFNQLFITELFYNYYEKWKLLEDLRKKYGVDFINEVLSMLASSKKEIIEMKEYYKSIFSHDMNYLLEINNSLID